LCGLTAARAQVFLAVDKHMLTRLLEFRQTVLPRRLAQASALLPQRDETARGYLYALALMLVALLLRMAIAPLDAGVQYVTFFPAVSLAAVVAGFWPGMLSVALGTALATFLFWPPYAMLDFSFHSRMLLSNATFVFDGVIVCGSIEAMHRYYRRFAAAEQELRLAASVYTHSSEGIMVMDPDGVVLGVNPAYCAMTGYARDELVGSKAGPISGADPELLGAVRAALEVKGAWHGELWTRRKNGEAYLEGLTINRVEDDPAGRQRYVGVLRDITELRNKDEQIRHLAFHDALTGLPNRTLLLDRLDHALERARRANTRLALGFFDLDRFKAVNDALGHEAGDLLLQETAWRIKSRLRAMDTAARLGGDEFVVLIEGLASGEDCADVVRDIIAAISQPLELRGTRVQIGASAGIACHPEDGDEAGELMRCADLAMYAAKTQGRNNYRFYHPGLALVMRPDGSADLARPDAEDERH
jgi:diguanylate cyclase (GGDEF)-like protein/PAS domain S-box-containing protein